MKLKRIGLVSLLVLLFLIMGCSQSNRFETEPEVLKNKGSIVIGSKSFTEQNLFRKMMAILLREQGFQVKELNFLDSASIRKAMEDQVIDLYWDYTNTARIHYHKKSAIYDADAAYQAVAAEDKQKGILWLTRSEFNSTWVILIKEDEASRLGIQTISDLFAYTQSHPDKLKFGTMKEFLVREDGWDKLSEVYGLTVDKNDILAFDNNLLFQALKESRIQGAIGWIADSRIKEYHLRVLADDREAFPPYHASPVILERTLVKYPELEPMLKELANKITNEKMLELNYRVDVQHQDVFQVARSFLIESGMIEK